ncbi:hypothetical protein Y032_0230g2983 [Ancylostoma ceylanicum]|uniref:Peptidase family M13 n=1 Tax=Ancylostoma ceylanicum TaxID=53326 RepID=A0A016SGY8_9BILA|nr:hypothetical protein Y032_0230g2983 [Ancylostoma ceylanicum]
MHLQPRPVKTLAWFYEKCVAARMNWADAVLNSNVVMKAVQDLAAGNKNYPEETKFPFYMLFQNETVKNFPTPRGLSYLLGHLAGVYGVPTIVPMSVDTNWKDPYGKNGYSLFIDQPGTMLPQIGHSRSWDILKPGLTIRLTLLTSILGAFNDIELDDTMLKKDAEDVAEFDHLLAMKYCSDDLSRKELERVYNPMTFPQMKQRYPNIDWVMLLTETTQLAPNVTRRILADPNYQFIVMEPEMLQRLSDALGESSKFVSPRTVVNYIYSQLLAAYSSFLPIPMMDSNNPNNNLTILEHIPTKTRPPPPRPRSIWPERPIYKQQQYDDEQAAQFSCAAESINTLKYANGRMFIDKIYPTQKSRKELRENVGKMISGILVGFRSMIDQLNWMTPASKLGAYKKIDHLVKNIGYPDWITDDEKLTKSYEGLDIRIGKDDYFTILQKVIAWKIGDHWNMLFDRSPDREDFSAPLGSANAWYQPQLNSITLPASILHSPFYHPDLPTAVNFGAMGMIVGHELTHGFDDMGVQWDGLGVLDGWMDYPSEVGFRQMADCVVEEYGRFCPFNKTEHGDVACVDGAATQGENIADNGGIRAAFRAYRNHINLHGPDPQLPDEQLQEFTSDQLFFMSFAQIWCQVPDDEASLRSQLMFDVHSPSMYRVWGTIQNFPAFKDAFHCPSSPYAPDKHCDVWVSEPDSSHGEPVVKTELNVRQNEPISPNNFEEYSAYKVAADYYKESVNTSVDPCTDFFQYACGKYDKPVSFGVGRAKIDENIAKKLYSPEYDATIKSSKALTKGKSFIDACVETAKDSSKNQQILATENYLLPRVNKLANYLGSNFTYVFGGEVSHRPDKTQLANALGYLSFDQGIDTFVTPMVDTNWPQPKEGYTMFLDQNTAFMSKSYYKPSAFTTIKKSYVNSATKIIATFAKAQNLRIDETKLKDDIRGLIEFEQMIALSYSTDDDTRRTYSRSWNPVDIEWLAEYSFVDWKVYMKQVPNVAQEVVQMPTFMVSVSEPEQLEKMTRDYGTWDQTKLVNYLFMRLVLSNAQYLPSYASGFDEMPEEPLVLGRRRPHFRFPKSNTVEDTQLHCVGLANQLMPYAIGRVYIDYEYPDNNKKQLIRKTTGNMMQNIIHSFQGMLDSLDWMTQKTKRKALEKTLDIVQNIAFPDWIMDNQKLDDYYKEIDFNVTQENYYDMWTKLIVFNIALVYKQLTAKEADRRDFLGQPATVNAWYMPELNSITFPAGILQPPYFHPLWPTSVNYGGLGVVAGHELIHGFDDQGVQWGPGGEMSLPSCGECTGWMDKNSTAGFKAMAECVIDEYNKFCPLDPSQFTPNCVNGANTQGENIADNGGIHTAFRAYRTHIALNGPDPLLPDRLFGQFTHDQLFFLSFAQVWCENRRSDDRLYQQLMVDPHSPAMYRVFGTIQNYPAFREAYNCPLETQYAPEQHCNVWMTRLFFLLSGCIAFVDSLNNFLVQGRADTLKVLRKIVRDRDAKVVPFDPFPNANVAWQATVPKDLQSRKLHKSFRGQQSTKVASAGRAESGRSL